MLLIILFACGATPDPTDADTPAAAEVTPPPTSRSKTNSATPFSSTISANTPSSALASEDASSARTPVDRAGLEDWVAFFGVTFPVLADPSYTVDPLYDPSARSRPTYVLIAPGMEIVEIGGEGSITSADLEAVLPTPYP